MAKEAKKDNKNIIIGACVAIVAVAIIVIAIVFGVNGKPALNDAYFVSDNTKYVLTLDSEDTEDETAPVKTHIVYFYSDDEVTGAKYYYEFKDADSAKAALETIQNSLEDANAASVDGKYIIIVADESEYKDVTASEVKEQIEFMETLKNMDYDDTEDGTDIIEVNTDDTAEE